MCCRAFTPKQRVPVPCPECEFAACTECVKAYLLSSTQDPHCMNEGCSRAYDDEFLDTHLTQTFRAGELKLHRQQTLLERQRALLPGRQHLVENEGIRRAAYAALKAAKEDVARAKAVNAGIRADIQLHKDAMARLQGGMPSWCAKSLHVIKGECLLQQGKADRCGACFARRCDQCQGAVSIIRLRGDREPTHVCVPVPADKKEVARALKGLRATIAELRRGQVAKRALADRVHAAEHELRRAYNQQEPVTEAVARKFVRACPQNGCRGFLSSAWKCGTCSTWACSNCHEAKGATKDAAHECNPDSVLTARLLDKDTRPCPHCASAIFKISGCAQMWCTACNTPFDWSTGRVLNGRNVHNPHYFEYLRRGGGAAAGAAAGGAGGGGGCEQGAELLPRVHVYSAYIKRQYDAEQHAGTNSAKGEVRLLCNELFDHYRRIGHVADAGELARLRRVANDDQTRAEEQLAIRYLMQDIGDDEWKQQLQRLEKNRNKCVAFMQVGDMYVQASASVMNTCMAGNQSLGTMLTQLDELLAYTKAAIAGVAKRYQCTPPRLGLTELDQM